MLSFAYEVQRVTPRRRGESSPVRKRSRNQTREVGMQGGELMRGVFMRLEGLAGEGH